MSEAVQKLLGLVAENPELKARVAAGEGMTVASENGIEITEDELAQVVGMLDNSDEEEPEEVGGMNHDNPGPGVTP